MMSEMGEKLKETRETQVDNSEMSQSEAEKDLVTCDLCIGTEQKNAIMSCLVCLVSYCETHLQPHYTVPKLKKHKLVKATCDLEERMCVNHDEPLKVFCRTDQQCICMLCTMDDHKGHETVTAKAERAEKQDELGLSQQKVQQGIQEREKELRETQQAAEAFKTSGHEAEKDSERIFTELICSIEKRRSEVKNVIRARQTAAVSQAEQHVERLEKEIAELKRTDAELEKISHIDDNIHFLQNYQSLSSPSVSSHFPSIFVPPLQFFSDVTKTVSELKEQLEDVIKGGWINITPVSEVNIFPPKRADFLQYSCQLSLDETTAGGFIGLSEENRKMTLLRQDQGYPANSDRFTHNYQVLCREAVSDHCYWEVEWEGGGVGLAVAYKDVSRGDFFGGNDKSWVLGWSFPDSDYKLKHNDVETAVSGPVSWRIGVYLDHKAGSLSFYSVSDTLSLTLLHSVQTTFLKPLYPGFGLAGKNGSAEIIKLW